MKTLIILCGIVFCTGIGALRLAEANYQQRVLISKIQELNEDIDGMKEQWSKLVLQESTLTDETLIYQVAEQSLGMQLPTSQKVVFLSN